MASAAHNESFGFYGDRMASAAGGVGARLRALARLVSEALEAQRRRAVEREIARLVARSGGRLTDSLEREIARRVLASEWGLLK
jgi:hypothetical protein